MAALHTKAMLNKLYKPNLIDIVLKIQDNSNAILHQI